MKNKNGAEMINNAGQAYGDLIREYRKRRGLSQAELGKLAHVKQNAVGACEAGRSRPDLASVPVLCRELSLPLTVFFGEEKEAPFEEVASRYARLNSYNRRVILKQMDALYELQTQTEADHPGVKLVEVYQNDLSACAGASYGIGESSGETVYLIADPVTEEADEIIRVSGDSMEPTFHDGDQVLVRHCDSLQEGQIGIFVNGDAGYIKEYRHDGLYSHNPRYAVMKFSDEDRVRCVGSVLGILQEEQIAGADDIAAWKQGRFVTGRG